MAKARWPETDFLPLSHVDQPVRLLCVCVYVAIIMTPTRELAMQIGRECRKFTRAIDLHVVCVYGGTGISEQIAELKRGAEVIVCTPGRMIDMLAANSGMIHKHCICPPCLLYTSPSPRD